MDNRRRGQRRGAFIRTIIVSVLAVVAVGLVQARAQAPQRPPIGIFGSPPDAMIFYVAHGAAGACGPGCSEWIAAEGTVQWDTHKRLINILDRLEGRRPPLVIHSWGQSDLNVSTSLGRILRYRGMDATAGTTEVEACRDKSEVECFGLKRQGGSFEAKVTLPNPACDLACVLILAGGVHRNLPQGGKVILTGRFIHNRLAPNVSAERREALTARFGEKFRDYLLEMGVAPEVMDIVDGIGEGGRPVEMPPSEWTRLRIASPTGP